jgi:polyisoprenoid-binding protein YceI
MIKGFNQFALLIALFATAVLATAEEPDLCSPFLDGKVDSALLETMLSAAQDGHLYRIQKSSSRVGFCVGSKLSRIEGSFTDFQGGISLDHGEQGDGQTLVLIKTGSLQTDNHLVKSMVMGERFFDVEHHPEVLFVSNGFKWTGPNTAVLTGKLTLRGITKPVIFNVKLTAVGDEPIDQANRVLVKAITSINRADFGMDELTTVVEGNVQLCMSVEALKYEA